MLTHSTHQGFYDNEFYKPIYLLTYLLHTITLCSMRYLVQPRRAVFCLLSANSYLFV